MTTETGGPPSGAPSLDRAPVSAAGPADSSAAPEREDWRGRLPDDLRAHPQLAKFTSAEALARSYINAERLIGAEKAPVPKGPDDAEGWERWHKAAGRPDSADGYSFVPPGTMPEGVEVDEGLLNLFRASAHKAGLNQRQFDGVAGMFLTYVAGQAAAARQAADLSLAEGEAGLQREWGATYDARLRLARAAVREAGGEELAAFLESTGLGNHPALVRAFAQIGERISGEDRLHGDRRDAGLSAADLDRAIAEFRKTHAQGLHDAMHPDHRRLVSELGRLYEQRYPGEG